MRWEEMTAGDFHKAVQRCKGVCVLPVSCLEKHGEHLPLGTDMLWGKALAEKAATMEPAVVFPPYYFGQINCGRHVPGTVAIRFGPIARRRLGRPRGKRFGSRIEAFDASSREVSGSAICHTVSRP